MKSRSWSRAGCGVRQYLAGGRQVFPAGVGSQAEDMVGMAVQLDDFGPQRVLGQVLLQRGARHRRGRGVGRQIWPLCVVPSRPRRSCLVPRVHRLI